MEMIDNDPEIAQGYVDLWIQNFEMYWPWLVAVEFREIAWFQRSLPQTFNFMSISFLNTKYRGILEKAGIIEASRTPLERGFQDERWIITCPKYEASFANKMLLQPFYEYWRSSMKIPWLATSGTLSGFLDIWERTEWCLEGKTENNFLCPDLNVRHDLQRTLCCVPWGSSIQTLNDVTSSVTVVDW